MNLLIAFLFRAIIYTLWGLVLEVIATAVGNIFTKGWNKDTKLLNGDVSLWMAPIYGFFIFFCFEPIHTTILFLPAYIRFAIWAFCFMAIEFIVGLAYDKLFHIRPWNYDKDAGNICGYTKFSLFAFWGWGALWVESLSRFLIYLTPTVIKYFGY